MDLGKEPLGQREGAERDRKETRGERIISIMYTCLKPSSDTNFFFLKLSMATEKAWTEAIGLW